MKNRLYILLLMIGCLACVATSQAEPIKMADLPYLCDFEDKWENRNWVLNPSIETITTTNAWAIGSAAAYTGKQSMYVSQDGGQTQSYASTNNVLLAYRDITLEAGDYDVAYDWMGTGNGAKGYLKVVYANRPDNGLKCLGNSAEPTWVANALQLTGSYTRLEGNDSWGHVQARISIPVAQANKTTTRLLFIWVNTDVTVKDSVTSVAIDNFQLAKASPNDYPENIHVTTYLGTTTVTWDGSSERYEVMYRQRGKNEFESVDATGNSVTLHNVEYGAYEFWICGINGEDKTIYTVFPTVYLYETDCFDALNMYNAEFEYGGWKYLRTTGLEKTIKGTERVDYGPQDVRSRHTTHFDRTEVDPRTVIKQGNDTIACLKTVPNGEFGSVRLGNWATGSEYESMTFHYTVESSSMAVLLIHYAMVLENPDHSAESQPRFTLDVLDEDTVPIDTKCASVDFHAPAPKEWEDPEVKALWHVNNWVGNASGSSSNSHVINWQDWKTIGISVEDYVGKTLTIKLTSYDCDQGGHFGYAYFMLNCVRSDVDGLPWGEFSTTRMFTAPEGFDYAWFDRRDTEFKDTINNTDESYSPYIREGGRYLYVLESDTNTYMCHVTYPTNAECGYWFDASGKPHTPKAELKLQWEPKDCKNGYRYWNRCHVLLTNQLTGEEEHRYDKQLDNCFIILPDGTEEAIGYDEEGVFVPMSQEGGTVRYGIRTVIYVNDELFEDTEWYELTIPAIGPLETHLYDSICLGQSVLFPENSRYKRSEPGIYYDSLYSLVTGCDSVVMLHLFVHQPIEVTVFDTICPGSTYTFAGKDCTLPGVYKGLFTSEVTHCDSLVTLQLHVAPTPSVKLLSEQLCSDAPLTYILSDGFYVDSMRIRIEDRLDTCAYMRRDDAQMLINLRNKDIGTHTSIVQWTMPWCETVWTDTLSFGVSLSSNVVELHFEDMLVFYSADYNGGLEVVSYQWYRNGELIPGATKSYYQEDGLDVNAEYTIRVTLADGSETWVCPFVPATLDVELLGPPDRQTYKVLRNGQLIIICRGREYDLLGRPLN